MTSTHSERLTEWLFASVTLGYGLWLLAPGDTFGGPQYAVMASLAPENVWGALAVAIGSLRMVALAVNGHWRRTPIIRMVCSAFGEMWWISVGFLLLSGPEHHVPAGIIIYPVFAIFEVISCGRAARDAFFEGSFRRAPKAPRNA